METYIDTPPEPMPTDGTGHKFNDRTLEPLTLRRQVLLAAIKQRLPRSELRLLGDYLGEACILLWLCSHSDKECDDLAMHKSPLTVIFDWAETAIKKGQKEAAIMLAISIWDEANSEAVVAVDGDDGAGKPSAALEQTRDGIARS